MIYLTLLLLLTSCAASRPFGAASVPALDAYAKRMETSLRGDDLAATMRERNAAIDGYLFLADRAYRDYEASLYGQRAAVETVADLAILGLSSGAALASGEALKTGLAAGAAALTGSKAIVNADFYENNAKAPIVITMREIRAAIRRRIELGKRLPVRQYPLGTAMLDVEDYAAVDVISAIEALTQQSTERLTVEQRALESVKALPVEER